MIESSYSTSFAKRAAPSTPASATLASSAMKKYYCKVTNNQISVEEVEVEIVPRPPYEYRSPEEHAYRISSPGKTQGEIWYWWAFSDSKEEANIKLEQIRNERSRIGVE